ncbi:hypothetical protein CWI38_0994p0030 [Hamiltosporidium tvaerminnensis]|uniref:Uncharacterized protein n=1 Tax=Hamiltosporidium tvaerminnensis TaxID=1176355 RepID=A0A4Q9LVR2_9MICR|nr:hypothetical protein CWI38_0994p0030 [Hamiltosporidium tvaerminnensis]
MTKPIILISSSLLAVLLALGIFGFISYRSANKFIENLESDYKKISESVTFKNFAALLKKEKIAMFTPNDDKINFNVLLTNDENDRNALLEALKAQKIDDFVQIKENLPKEDPNDVVTMEKPSLPDDPGFFAKVGLLLKKKQTMVSVKKLTAFIKARLDVPHDENNTWIVFLNILDKIAVESFCVEIENKKVKSISKSLSFTIDRLDEKNTDEIADFIAYIIEKNRKKDANEKAV